MFNYPNIGVLAAPTKGLSRVQLYLLTPLTELSVWVLEDYDTQEWILKHNMSSLQFLGLLSRPVDDFDILAIHPYHNLIILVQHWNQKLVSYNMDSKELRALRTLGKGYRILTPYVPCFMESAVLTTKDWGCCLWGLLWIFSKSLIFHVWDN